MNYISKNDKNEIEALKQIFSELVQSGILPTGGEFGETSKTFYFPEIRLDADDSLFGEIEKRLKETQIHISGKWRQGNDDDYMIDTVYTYYRFPSFPQNDVTIRPSFDCSPFRLSIRFCFDVDPDVTKKFMILLEQKLRDVIRSEQYEAHALSEAEAQSVAKTVKKI